MKLDRIATGFLFFKSPLSQQNVGSKKSLVDKPVFFDKVDHFNQRRLTRASDLQMASSSNQGRKSLWESRLEALKNQLLSHPVDIDHSKYRSVIEVNQFIDEIFKEQSVFVQGIHSLMVTLDQKPSITQETTDSFTSIIDDILIEPKNLELSRETQKAIFHRLGYLYCESQYQTKDCLQPLIDRLLRIAEDIGLETDKWHISKPDINKEFYITSRALEYFLGHLEPKKVMASGITPNFKRIIQALKHATDTETQASETQNEIGLTSDLPDLTQWQQLSHEYRYYSTLDILDRIDVHSLPKQTRNLYDDYQAYKRNLRSLESSRFTDNQYRLLIKSHLMKKCVDTARTLTDRLSYK